jgi:hypothetical protein
VRYNGSAGPLATADLGSNGILASEEASVTVFAEGVWTGRRAAASWQTPWLLSRNWDLTYISLSAILVPTPFLLFALLQYLGVETKTAVAAVDIAVALIVGGPHMTSTYTLTFMDKTFVHRYPVYVALALTLPVMVTLLALWNLTLLLTVFMMWASVHVLCQIGYLTDCYRAKGSNFRTLLSRGIDYGVIFSSLYPMAMIKLVNNDFRISNTLITFPLIVGQQWAIYAANGLFFTFLFLFLGKTYLEYIQRRANFPKTLLMAISICVAYIVPSASNLDVAFQGMNVWHSFQYLGLTWYMNELRQERGEITSKVVDRISGPRKGPVFYLFNLGLTLGLGAMVVVLTFALQIDYTKSYYIVVLSCLLIHYYFDQFMFFRVGELVRPA